MKLIFRMNIVSQSDPPMGGSVVFLFVQSCLSKFGAFDRRALVFSAHKTKQN